MYRVRRPGINRDYALKLIRRKAETARQLARARAELTLLERLHGVPMPHVHEFGEVDGRLWILTDFVYGTNLLEHADSLDLNRRGRVMLMASVCRSVAKLHERGVIHRDLKPENVVVADGSEPVLIDFGIAFGEARLPGEDVRVDHPAGGARAEVVGGTPPYAAPEQLRGEVFTTTADVHALGVMLFELLAGQLPWRTSRGRMSDLEYVSGSRQIDWTAADEEIPRPLKSIIARATSPDPDQRFSSVLALSEDLERWAHGVPPRCHSMAWYEQAWSFTRRSPAKVAFGLAAVALLVVLVLEAGAYARVNMAERNSIARITRNIDGYAADGRFEDALMSARSAVIEFESMSPDQQAKPEAQEAMRKTQDLVFLLLARHALPSSTWDHSGAQLEYLLRRARIRVQGDAAETSLEELANQLGLTAQDVAAVDRFYGKSSE